MAGEGDDEWLLPKSKKNKKKGKAGAAAHGEGRRIEGDLADPVWGKKAMQAKEVAMALREGPDVFDEATILSYVGDIRSKAAVIKQTSLYERFCDTLKTELKSGDVTFSQIVCLGVGNFVSQESPMLQMAFLYLLREDFLENQVEQLVVMYDPIFTELEMKICAHLNMTGMESAWKGCSAPRGLTLYYMPHCPYELYGSILDRNREAMSQSVIIGNSFSSYTSCLRPEQYEGGGERGGGIDSLRLAAPFTTELSLFDMIDSKKCKHTKKLRLMAHAFADTSLMYFTSSISTSTSTSTSGTTTTSLDESAVDATDTDLVSAQKEN